MHIKWRLLVEDHMIGMSDFSGEESKPWDRCTKQAPCGNVLRLPRLATRADHGSISSCACSSSILRQLSLEYYLPRCAVDVVCTSCCTAAVTYLATYSSARRCLTFSLRQGKTPASAIHSCKDTRPPPLTGPLDPERGIHDHSTQLGQPGCGDPVQVGRCLCDW